MRALFKITLLTPSTSKPPQTPPNPPHRRSVLDFFRKQKVRAYDRASVLGALPFELKSKILRHLYASAIRSVPLLAREADNDVFLTDICGRLQPYACSERTFVYRRGAISRIF